MQRNDARWWEHLDLITAWGEASAANQTPPPTDAQLWGTSRLAQDLHLPEQIDPALLGQLRVAFNQGRYPRRIDLAAVADALRKRGHDAVVEHTSGGVVVVYAGRQAPDRYGDLRWSAALGPGWYERRDLDRPIADPADCSIGPDRDDTWAIPVPANWTTGTLAELTAAVIDEVEAGRARFTQAADAARDAMWAAFAARYPEVTTGDVPPDAEHTFVTESDKLLAGWLDDNAPDRRQPPAHLVKLAERLAAGNGADGPAGGAGPHEPQ
nr:hypothetical protein GCM10020063_009070 [Dactylosporangium thailandense]